MRERVRGGEMGLIFAGGVLSEWFLNDRELAGTDPQAAHDGDCMEILSGRVKLGPGDSCDQKQVKHVVGETSCADVN